MSGNVRNLWECRANGVTATLDRDGKKWRVSITTKDGSTKAETFKSIGLAHAAFDQAADTMTQKK